MWACPPSRSPLLPAKGARGAVSARARRPRRGRRARSRAWRGGARARRWRAAARCRGAAERSGAAALRPCARASRRPSRRAADALGRRRRRSSRATPTGGAARPEQNGPVASGTGAKLGGGPGRRAGEYFSMAPGRPAVASQVAGFERSEIREGDCARADLAPEICAVARNHLVPCSVFSHDKRVAPAGAAVDAHRAARDGIGLVLQIDDAGHAPSPFTALALSQPNTPTRTSRCGAERGATARDARRARRGRVQQGRR